MENIDALNSEISEAIKKATDLKDLEEIQSVLSAHPGQTPVLLHLQSGTGKRATIECGELFRVRKSEALQAALGRWMD